MPTICKTTLAAQTRQVRISMLLVLKRTLCFVSITACSVIRTFRATEALYIVLKFCGTMLSVKPNLPLFSVQF